MDISISTLYRIISDRDFPAGKRLSDADTRKFWKIDEIQN